MLQPTHDIFSIVLSPMDLGWPIRRTRLFTCALNRQTLAWVGPSQTDLPEHFMKFFKRALKLNGDVFLVASADEVQAEQARMCAKRGLSLEGQQVVPAQHLYAPGQLVRLQEYDAQRCAEQGVAGSSAYFADFEQNPGHGASTPGAVIPSTLTHGTLHAWTANRPVLTQELLLAHGFHVYGERTTWPLQCQIKDYLQSLSVSQQKLVGNGWHLAVIASWTMYVLSHTVRMDSTGFAASIEPERTLLRQGGSGFLSMGGLSRGKSSFSLGSNSGHGEEESDLLPTNTASPGRDSRGVDVMDVADDDEADEANLASPAKSAK